MVSKSIKALKKLSTSKKIFKKSSEEPLIPSNYTQERDFCDYGAWQYIGIHLLVH